MTPTVRCFPRKPHPSGSTPGVKNVILVSRCSWTLFNFRSGLIRELVENGVQVIAAGATDGGYANRLEQLGARFWPLDIDKRGINPISDLFLLNSLRRLYREHQPAIVHHFTIKPVIYGSIAAWYARVPLIVNTITGLGYVFTAQARSPLRKFVEAQYKIALGISNITFFQNADDRNTFVTARLIRPEKARLVPGSGVDTNRFTSASPQDLVYEHASDNSVVFLMMARLLRDKGLYEYVEAASTLQKLLPNCRFLLLGDRDERNPTVISVDELARWEESGLLRWLGRTDDVRPYVSEADVIVLPSYREGLPKSLLEACAMGKPIVATDVPGCRDVVRDGINGFLVPPRNASALAKAMRLLAENPALRHQMGKAGREIIEKDFSEQVVIRKTFDAYGF